MTSTTNGYQVSLDTVMDFKKVEQNLITDLQKLSEFSRKLNLSKSVDLIEEVLQRVKNRTFNVAIVGEFRRGKSTFINALIGQSILPSDVIPTTATLNRVTYGLKPAAKIFYKDGQEETIPYDQLSNYVTKLTDESERKAASVKEAVIYYPVPYCQNNIDILDTPGLNDDQNMTEVTLGVLPMVDAAIMIILAQSPFSQYEKDLLENHLINQDLGRIIFVLNIWNDYTSEQAERVLNNVKTRIQKYVFDQAELKYGKNSDEYQIYRQKIGEPKVFGIYVKQALDAKQKGDEDGLVASGFRDFETALEQFLTKDQGIIHLQVPMNRTIGSAKEILAILDIQESALSMEKEEFDSKYQSSVIEIETVRKRHKQEIQLVDGKAANVKMLVKPYLYELPNQIKQAASKAIDDISIDPKELNNEKALGKKISTQVSNAVQRTAASISQQIQNEVQKGIDQEVERLKDFAHSVEQALNNIEMQFVEIEASSQRRTSGAAEAITAALSVFTGFGGIWSGYRVAGAKGAAVGAAGSLGTAVVGGLLAGLIGLPIALPVIFAIGIISIFTGGGLAKMAFRRDRVENYRKDYKEKVIQQIDKEMQNQHLEQKVDEQITTAFEMLKDTLQQEVDSRLDNTEQTLKQLSEQHGKDETMTKVKQAELEHIRTETERILGNAQGLSKALVEIMSV